MSDDILLDGGDASTLDAMAFDGGGAIPRVIYTGPTPGAPAVPQTVDGGAADTTGQYRLDGGNAATTGATPIDGGGAGPSVTTAQGVAAQPRIAPRPSHGDPRLFMTQDGTELRFENGQPIMDGGLVNLALISLFTSEGWCGNAFMNPNSRIGSDFEAACHRPITRDSLNRVRDAAQRALKDDALGTVTVAVTNPTGSQLRITAQIQPPAGSTRELTLIRNAGNWYAQAQFME